MDPRRISSDERSLAAMHVVVLYDDHLTASRGRVVARGVADEMGLGAEYEARMWNVALLETSFARTAAVDLAKADILIVALRDEASFSRNLKTSLRRWLIRTKDSSAALIAVFVNDREPASREVRAFLQRAARSAGKEYYCESTDLSSNGDSGDLHELAWVL